MRVPRILTKFAVRRRALRHTQYAPRVQPCTSQQDTTGQRVLGRPFALAPCRLLSDARYLSPPTAGKIEIDGAPDLTAQGRALGPQMPEPPLVRRGGRAVALGGRRAVGRKYHTLVGVYFLFPAVRPETRFGRRAGPNAGRPRLTRPESTRARPAVPPNAQPGPRRAARRGPQASLP